MNKNPPFFAINNSLSDSDLKLIREIYFLDKKDFEFITMIRDSILNHPSCENEVSIDVFKTSNISTKNGVRKRLNKLVDLGLLKKLNEKRPEWFRPITIYSFKNLNSEIIEKKIKKNSNITSSQFNGGDLGDFFLQIMFLGLSINQDDNFRSKEEMVHIRDQALSVKVSSSYSRRKFIANIYDFRFFVAALNLCENETIRRDRAGESGDNFFELKASLINNFLGRNNTGGNISSLINSFERLSDSTFYLDEWPSFITDKYGIEEASLRISPISNLTIIKQKKRTFIAFSVPHSIYKSFLADNLKTIRFNKTLLSEKNEVLFALNVYIRKLFIGNKSKTHGPISLFELSKQIASHITYENFKKKLFNGLMDVFRDEVSKGLNPVDTILKKGMKATSNRESIKNKIQIPIMDENQEIVSYFAEINGYYFKISGDQCTMIIKDLDLSNISANDEKTQINQQDEDRVPEQGVFEF